jgi:hypothetical protein
MASRPNKFRGVENKAYIEGMRQIRRSNAAQPQDSRPNRERSRRDQLNASIKRSRNEE